MTDPPYDDETHEAKNARFLRDHVIPDQWLARGLDRLARDEDEKSHALVFIDYKSLGVRHLGSIYEGLLEFKLHIAAEKMAVVEGKKTEEIIPYGEAQESKRKILKTGRGKEAVERVLAPDTVYLENDRRERKAAGAYYTPDYIVQYIVEHAVGPVLEEKFAALTSKLRNAQKTLKQEQDKAAALRKTVGKHDDPEHQAYLKHRHLVDELFDVKVLDPAMGSGHFLVEAVDFLTDRMLHFLNGFPWNPVLAHLKETRETILQEMERQGISIDTGRLSDVNLLKRHVLKRCIYGVDLNPMAVELAKVSLWLDCFTLGAPLSFLDHHLKCGNSIIGATVDEVDKALETKGQTTFFHTSEFARELVAVDLMRRIGELSDVTPDQVRESRREFRNAVSALMPAKTVMDVYVSRWFGNEPVVKNKGKGLQDIALDFLRTTEAAQWLKHPEKLGDLNAKDQKLAETALLASREKRFFHWEIEFPEVFFAPRQGTTQIVEKKPNAGFDAVIGNPPWGADVVQDPLYVRDSFKLLSGKINLFALFTEKASLLKHHHGALAFVVPSLLMMSQQFTALRRYLLHTIHVSHILVLPKKQFPDAYVDSCVFVAGNGESAIEVLNLEEDQPGEIDLLCRQGQSVPIKQWDTEECLFEYRSAGGKITLPKPASTCIQPLETQFDVYYGLTPYSKASGQSDRVIKDQAYHSHEKSTPSHQPYLEGDDVDRYAINWSGLYIKYGSWLAGPKKPAHFSKGRLLIRESTGRARRIYACVDDLGYYHGHPIIAAKGTSNFSPLALSAVVNSTYMRKWHLTYSASSTKEDFPRILPGDVAKLPLRRIHFTTPKAERKAMIQKLVGLYESNRFADQLQEVDRLLPKDKDGSFMAFRPGATGVEEKSDVIHDLLVHLAELMMTLNKQKQAEMKRFLNWLETRLKIAPGKDGEATLHSLNRKTTLLNYLGDYQKSEDAEPFSTIVAVLRKNRARLGISMSDKATIDKIETEYQTSLSKLIPIKDRLAHTDRLIDQIVYKLYGLTDEEIAIVGSKP